MGLYNTPATFYRQMNLMLSDMMHYMTIYLNKTLVYSPTLDNTCWTCVLCLRTQEHNYGGGEG